MPPIVPVDTSSAVAHRRLDIQGLRAVAVLSVMAYHAGLPVPGGFVGVDIFFVISGFVITGLLLRERTRTGRVRLRSFYWRRFKRLAPALATVLSVCLVLSIPILSPFGSQQVAASTAIAATFSLANIFIARSQGDYFGAPAEGNLFLNTWSLSVEEQFYLVLPALLIVLWAIARSPTWGRRSAIAGVALLSLVSFGLAVLGSTGYSLDRLFWLLGFFSPLTRVWEFGVGVLLALLPISNLLRRFPGVVVPASLVGAALIITSFFAVSSSTPWPGPWTLIPVLGTIFILMAGTSSSPPTVVRILSSQPMVATGDRSYSLYLWHWPLIVLAVALWGDSLWISLAAVAASILPALLSFAMIEEPLRRATVQRRLARITLVSLALGVPLAIGMLVGRGADATWGLPTTDKPLFGAGSFGLGECMRFTRDKEASPLLDASCKLGDPSGARAIYLVGDSQAAQWTEALDLASRELDASLRVATAPGCPFIDIYKASAAGIGADDRACRETY
jgi:peptidoglycan/LPS O-acetylase OafA/YrhL